MTTPPESGSHDQTLNYNHRPSTILIYNRECYQPLPATQHCHTRHEIFKLSWKPRCLTTIHLVYSTSTYEPSTHVVSRVSSECRVQSHIYPQNKNKMTTYYCDLKLNCLTVDQCRVSVHDATMTTIVTRNSLSSVPR